MSGWGVRGALMAGVLMVAAAASPQTRPGGFVITGRVTDAAGTPVPGTFVTAMLPDNMANGREVKPVTVRTHTRTTGDGSFHLELPYAGEVYVVALPKNDQRGARQGYGNTFHPNARSRSAAKLVKVMPGQPAVADITLLAAPLASVSGVVLGSNGQPVSRPQVFIAHGDGFFGMDSTGFVAGPNGTFRVSGIQPGTYFFGYRETEWPPPRGTIPKVSQATVVVSREDVSNVRVVPLEMVSATGRIVIAAEDRKSFDPRAVRVSGYPVPWDGNPGPTRAGDVREDLTFEFAVWPMPTRVRVDIQSTMWVVKAVRMKGVDLTDKTIDFVQGKPITGLEIELARR